MTREHPIIFSAPMVSAILQGRKTQMRRALKPQPVTWRYPAEEGGHECEVTIQQVEGTPNRIALGRVITKQRAARWNVGDHLWVRETWAPNALTHGQTVNYRADGGAVVSDDGGDAKWRPSIHMPRSASRITLRVTALWVERLQEISEADAEAEGAEAVLVPPDGGSKPRIAGFQDLWASIHGPDSWDANPWVCVTVFERIS